MANLLSVTIITLNEEKNIERCLKSVLWADEILIVDSGSTDKTLEICKKHNCKIIQTEWLGFGPTKKLAVKMAANDWILCIDADEQVTEELKQRIGKILSNPQAVGYRIKRKSFYLGKMVNHSGWDRDFPLKLFNRQFGNFNDKLVHESVVLSGEVKKIKQPLLHYTYPSITSHIKKMDKYSHLGAESAAQKGKSATILGAIIRGIIKFVKMYFLELGLLDGKIGFVLCYNSAFGTYLKYLKLWEKNR